MPTAFRCFAPDDAFLFRILVHRGNGMFSMCTPHPCCCEIEPLLVQRSETINVAIMCRPDESSHKLCTSWPRRDHRNRPQNGVSQKRNLRIARSTRLHGCMLIDLREQERVRASGALEQRTVLLGIHSGSPLGQHPVASDRQLFP